MNKINELPKKHINNKKLVNKNQTNSNTPRPKFAAIDLGTNSCRLVIASPTTTGFRIVETYSKVVRLGQGIIQNNELSVQAMKRTINTLKNCSKVIAAHQPLAKTRFVATAACRRAKNVEEFVQKVKEETKIDIEVISSKEEARLSVVGCLPLLNRRLKRVLVFDIGGGSTQITLARVTDAGKTFVEGFVSLPYGVVTISEAFCGQEMTNLEYSTVVDRTAGLLKDFDDKYNIKQAMLNNEIQVIGTSGTVTVIGAVHLRLPRYNRSAVDGVVIDAQDVANTINKIKNLGIEGRYKHPCIGKSKSDLTMAGCAIIEALVNFFPILDITIADRGIREGILLDLMHSMGQNSVNIQNKKKKWKKNNRFPFDRRNDNARRKKNNQSAEQKEV